MKRHEFTVVINNKEIRKVQVDFTTELRPSTGVLNLEGVTPSKHVFLSLFLFSLVLFLWGKNKQFSCITVV